MKSTVDKVSYYLMLVAPFLLAVSFMFLIQNSKRPLKNDYRYRGKEKKASAPAKTAVKDRVSLVVVLEIFAVTLIIRPWEFPWKTGRFLAAEIIFLIWGALVIPMAMHSGRLLGLHALGMMVLLGFILPVCILALFMRDLVFRRDKSGGGQRGD